MTRNVEIMMPLREFLTQLPADPHLFVAYSGGVDSSVLLHGLRLLCDEFNFSLTALHVHHGLNPSADDWVKHCQLTCERWSIPLKIHYLRGGAARGESIEAWARARRREIFANYLDNADKYVVLAQHMNDQAETLLLQLLRGSGSRGLAAMPSVSPLADGCLARPFLSVSRHEIVAFAHQQKLTWVEDSSNLQTDFDRNYVRQKVWPILSQRWPSAAATIARSAELLAQQNRVLDLYCREQLEKITDHEKYRIQVSALARMERDVQLLLLRYWLRHWNVQVPGSRRLEAGLSMLLSAGPNAIPCLAWNEHRISRYRDYLYLYRDLAVMPASIPIQPGETLAIKGIGVFRLEAGYPGFYWDGSTPLTLRFRLGGERMALRRGGPHRSVKKLLQEWGVLPWLRQRLPLLYGDKQLLAVADLAIAAEHLAATENGSYCLRRLPDESAAMLHFAFPDYRA